MSLNVSIENPSIEWRFGKVIELDGGFSNKPCLPEAICVLFCKVYLQRDKPKTVLGCPGFERSNVFVLQGGAND